MKNIENIINYVFKQFSSNCSNFKSGICTRPGGCLCKTFSEEKGYSLGIVPEKYKDKNIYSMDDICKLNDKISKKSVKDAQNNLWNFLYSSPFKPGLNQTELDVLSNSLDEKIANGWNVVIHGSTHSCFDKHNMQKILPTGKSLIAAIIMKQIIRRRIYSRLSKTYEWISFPNLTSNIFQDNMVEDYGDIDCVVIDDIDMVLSKKEKYDKAVLTKLEEFFSYRMSNNKSNILVFSRDLSGCDISEMGYSLAKIISSNNSAIIKID